MLSPKHPPSALAHTPASSIPSTSALHARRVSRYTHAESALRSAVESSSTEISPQELQIRVLEQATSLLSEQARDAQLTAAQLRTCLAHNGKDLSPEEVRSLQRECWLEERRSSARQIQTAHTRDLLTKLCSPISEVPPPLVESPAGMSRHESNLAKFIQLSPTRVSFPPHARSASTSPSVLYRRQTISQTRPMRLRASALELALRCPIQSRRRSKSLDGSHSRRNSDSTDATFVEEDPPGSSTTNALQLKLPLSPLMHDSDGIISIHKLGNFEPRARDTLIAEVGDVALPEYAVGLLEDLVASSLDITPFEIKPTELAPSSSVPRPKASVDSTIDSTNETTPRTSSSLPHFKFTKLPDFMFLDPSPLSPNPPSTSSLSSRPSSPPLSSVAPTDIIGRLRSPPDDTASSSFPPVRLRPVTSNAHLRAASTQSMHVLHSGSLSKGTSVKLTSPSLVTVPEGTMDVENRPQSSMSGYRYGLHFNSEDTVIGREERRAGTMTIKRKFSFASFRRRRFLSQGDVDLSHEDAVSPSSSSSSGGGGMASMVAAAMSIRGGQRPRFASSGEQGILARFKRRLTGQ